MAGIGFFGLHLAPRLLKNVEVGGARLLRGIMKANQNIWAAAGGISEGAPLDPETWKRAARRAPVDGKLRRTAKAKGEW